MTSAAFAQVTDRDGARGSIQRSQFTQTDTDTLLVRLETGQALLIPREMLLVQEDGNYVVPARFRDLMTSDPHSAPTVAFSPHESTGERVEQHVIPLIAEEFQIAKREVERGKVRLHKTVHEREVTVDEPLAHERVEVTRVPVNRVLDQPAEIRYEGDTLVVPLMEEVLVVEKRLMLREEVHVTRRKVEAHDPQIITLRREEVEVERTSDLPYE